MQCRCAKPVVEALRVGLLPGRYFTVRDELAVAGDDERNEVDVELARVVERDAALAGADLVLVAPAAFEPSGQPGT